METVNQSYDRRTFIDWCAKAMTQLPVVGIVAKCVIRFVCITCCVRASVLDSAAICYRTTAKFNSLSALMSWNTAKQLLLFY